MLNNNSHMAHKLIGYYQNMIDHINILIMDH